MDSMFLDIEKSGPSVAVGSAMMIEGKAPSLAEVRSYFRERIKDMPRFRQKVVSSRTKVRQAKWVDVEPDLEYHIDGVKLKPGESFDPVVGKIMERPMDRNRPLWDATVVTGYSTTEWTVIIRLHHSIADGQGALILLGELIDVTPDGSFRLAAGIKKMMAPKEREDEAIETDGPVDAAVAQALRSIEKSLEALGQLIATSPDTIRSMVSMAPRRPTELTGPVTDHRKWVGGQFSLDEVKLARKSFKGVTINDMVLAAVAIGFSKLLESRGVNPNGRTLRAVMPVSLRRDFQANNQVSILPAPLPLGEMDPVKRMRQIKESTKHAKRSMLPIISDQMLKASQKVIPAPVQEYVMAKAGVGTELFSETLVTNVPGPMIDLYFMGHPAKGNIPIIPIEGSMRIIVGITSYKHDLNIGITGDGEHAKDVDVLLAGIISGFEEICKLGAERAAKKGSKVAAAAAAAAPTAQPVAKKAPAKKGAAKKPAVKKAPAKKAPAKKAPAKKAPAKKAPAKKAPAKKAPAKKAPAKKAAAAK